MKVVLLCGGGGTRLWPLSREKKPKQFHRLLVNHSLIQVTVLRLRELVPMEDIFISTNKAFRDELEFQFVDIPRRNIICEPEKRDNSAAIGLSLVTLLHISNNPDETIVFLPSDHVIENNEEFLRAIKNGDELIKKYPDYLVQIGVKPTFPATNFGYIKMSEEKLIDGGFRVESFKEKPSLEVAEEYLSSWQYLWNFGVFMATGKTFLELYKKHLPQTYEGLQIIKENLDTDKTPEIIEREYKNFDKISIDFGIIEKTDKIAVIPTNNLGWTDIGNWRELRDVQSKNMDDQGNVIQGKVIPLSTTNSLIYSNGKRLITTYGLDDMIIVDTDDALLILPAKDNAHVKEVVDRLKQEGLNDYL